MFAYLMKPAYRYGGDTPWGGDALQRVFGKEIPCDRTGEALEASTLAGLESRAPDGRTLTEIAGGPLPLLLKLLDAREALSVQVHPDDAYANANEGGKLGKTEAWLILDATPGARLVYGLLPGTDVRALTGGEIESRLRWIEVRAGDVLYIPAGMVHAIGPGILLYEIQQASDVTYRFWDWGRLGADGKPRALHWEKALDVARADLRLDPARGETKAVPGGEATRYISDGNFTLDRLRIKGRMVLPHETGFRFVTALGDGKLVCGQESMAFGRGETLFVPEGTAGLIAEGDCELIVSAQGKKA